MPSPFDTPQDDELAHVEPKYVLLEGKDTRSAWSKFVEAVWAIKVRLITTTSIGLGLIFAGEYNLEGHIQNIFIHLGTAFLVVAIVNFGLELAPEYQQSESLRAILLRIFWRHAEIFDASAEKAIQKAMRYLSRNNAAQFGEQFAEFALAIGRLAQGDWTGKAYLKFIAAFHGELTKKTQILANLSEGSTGKDARVDMPNAVRMADVLIGNIMRELIENGGRYHAVSDILTWTKAGLSDFTSIQEEASKKVNMQRLFVLGFESDRSIPPAEIRRIIFEHFAITCALGSKYEMKITTADEYRKSHLSELEERHFGIFVPGSGRAIAIFVKNNEISNFRLTEASRPMCSEFATLWSQFETLPYADIAGAPSGSASNTIPGPGTARLSIRETKEGRADLIINDYLMAYFIGRVPRDGEYRGISFLRHWSKGNYDRFFNASVRLLRDKAFHMKRIFVIDDADAAMPETANVMRSHASLRSSRGDRYDFKICTREQLPPELRQELPFGLLSSGSDESADEVIAEIAQPARGFEASPPGKFEKMSELFDHVWKELDPITSPNAHSPRVDHY
jgi:hypothetical protein